MNGGMMWNNEGMIEIINERNPNEIKGKGKKDERKMKNEKKTEWK